MHMSNDHNGASFRGAISETVQQMPEPDRATYDPSLSNRGTSNQSISVVMRLMAHRRATYDPPVRLMTHLESVNLTDISNSFTVIHRFCGLRLMTHRNATYDPPKCDL